jgi:hypothetical protein
MKKNVLTIVLMLLFVAAFAEKPAKLKIIYFHLERRCPTCISIEENTKKTLDTYFAKQMEDGTIVFQVYDAEDSKNQQLVEKYEADGSSLFLTQINDGKETTTNFTNFAFSYSRNEAEKFIAGLKEEIEKNLR